MTRLLSFPKLPSKRAQLIQRIPQGTLVKAEAIYDKAFWRDAGLSGQAVADVGPARTTFDASPRSGQRSHMGDARGHWEGDTLVVETTNFDPRTVYQNGSAKLTMTERYRPVAANKIEWTVTLTDPDTWTKPWTFGMTLTADPDQPLFEYACHEGNYAMRNILSAARAEEAASSGGSQK